MLKCMTKIVKNPSKIRTLQPPNLDEYLNKSYTLDKSEKYNQFLQELGVEKIVRGKALTLKPTVTLSKEGVNYILTTNYSKENITKLTFRVGQKVQRQLPKGGLVISVTELKDNKLIERQNSRGKKIVIVREFWNDDLTVTMEVNKVKCLRHYKLSTSKHSIGTETSRRGSLFQTPVESDVELIEEESIVGETSGEENESEGNVCF